tara:strand:+ start:257 stop:1045 length:789 start_codon:yes stop_codon:yes gene_type:complete
MLIIPPGWTIEKRATNTRERIQVYCRDSKGRAQYIYHPLWTALTSSLKFKKLVCFSRALKNISQKTRDTDDIDNLIKLMISTNIRVGSDCYAEDNETFGVCTLLTNHIKKGPGRGEVVLCFCGKSGHKHEVVLRQGPHANFIKTKLRNARNEGGKRLFPHGTAQRLRARFKEILGDDFNPKDIRTYKANITLVKELRKLPGSNTKKELKTAIGRTAESLHHTTSVCKTNYLCPQLMELWLKTPSTIKKPGVNFYKIIKTLKV